MPTIRTVKGDNRAPSGRPCGNRQRPKNPARHIHERSPRCRRRSDTRRRDRRRAGRAFGRLSSEAAGRRSCHSRRRRTHRRRLATTGGILARLFTPAKFDGLDGHRFPARKRSLPTKDEMADYLESYAVRFDLPVHLNTRVERLHKADGRFRVESDWRRL